MIQKWSFIFYVFSSMALIYAAFLQSPWAYNLSDWEGTRSPILFYGIAPILILHIIITGKLHNKEKYSKVMWISGIIMVATAFLMLPRILAFILY